MVLTKLVTGDRHVEFGTEILRSPTTAYKTARKTTTTNRGTMRHVGRITDKFIVYTHVRTPTQNLNLRNTLVTKVNISRRRRRRTTTTTIGLYN